MKRLELLSRILIVMTVVGVVGVTIFLRQRTPLVHARTAENGGWSPDVVRASVGEPLHLRLTSDDVVHGFAIGQMAFQSVDVLPGEVTDVTLSFSKPGTYTFYCTRWCGINHWRMRGTIEVSGSGSDAEPGQTPLYAALGINLDAPHESLIVPISKPSAAQGEEMLGNMSVSQFTDLDFYRVHSPSQTWQDLRTKPALSSLNDQQIWNLVAFIWQSNTTPEGLADGQRLFARNCAACHGEKGTGDGVFANQLAASGVLSSQNMAGDEKMAMQKPAGFTDPKRMLGASPALLEGKILRGGMGTGMPSWGPIFTEKQIWDLISYLYSFQFDVYLQGAN